MDLDGEIAGGVFFVPNVFLFYFPLETCITCMLGKHMLHFFRFTLTSQRKTEQETDAKETNSDRKKGGKHLTGDKMEGLESVKKKKINFLHNHMGNKMQKEQEPVESNKHK